MIWLVTLIHFMHYNLLTNGINYDNLDKYFFLFFSLSLSFFL